jgi:DNA repair exonuclease SbcCD ATPase subunit
MEWLKEILKSNGVTEVEAIVSQVKKEIPSFFVAKADFNSVNEAKKDLEEQIRQRDRDLSDLKKSNSSNEELQKQFESLQAEYKTKTTEHEAKIKAMTIDNAIKLQLAGKVHDADMVCNLFNKDNIVLNEQGGIKSGLDEQLETLQKEKAFLFVETKPVITSLRPAESKLTSENVSLGQNFANEANNTNTPTTDIWG